ncbi:MAG: Asp-tRNA(Asn)/Glu-tRNA(Gln) amidotransferase subunit GatC [bacterium]
MSELTSDHISHLAHLSRLELSSEEQERFASQLTGIVGYVEQLSEVDTSKVKQPLGVTGMTNVLAADVVRGEDDPRTVARDSLLAGAPAREGAFIEVRAVLGEEVTGA